jgi:diguanylate cyclase (GGDEF)-like protein
MVRSGIGASRSALFTLNEPRSLSAKQKSLWAFGASAYLLVTVLAYTRSTAELTPHLWFPITQAWVLSAISGVISFLLYWQANASDSRGFLWLAGTFMYLCIILFSFPMYFPGAIAAEGVLLGDIQSSITVFYLWHFAVVVGCLVSALLLRSGRKRSEGSVSHGIVIGVCVAGLLAVASLVWVSLGEPYLFGLITEEGITSLAVAVDYALLAVSVIALIVVSPFVLSGSFIQRWIVVVLALAVGEAVVNVTVDRWSFGWYFNRGFGMVALGALLVVLAWRIAILNQETNQAAAYDTLTGARSRLGVMAALASLVQTRSDASPFTLLWIDLDNFKHVNDQHGHEGGDNVLRAVAARLQECIRGHDLVGRMGGDEFVVLLQGGAEPDAIASRIMASVKRPIRVSADAQVEVSCSVGIARWPGQGVTVEELLHAADLAMYEAKGAGGNTARTKASA